MAAPPAVLRPRSLALTVAGLFAVAGALGAMRGRPGARPVAAGADGLWADLTPSHSMVDAKRDWFCSTRGWLYVSAGSGSVSSEAFACTTPKGNDYGWAGGSLSAVSAAGGRLSFRRSNGPFGRSADGCSVAASVAGDSLKGTQTCALKYTDPFGMRGSAEATVQGPYVAERASFSGQEPRPLGCDQERTLRPQGLAAAAIVLFENRGGQPLTVFALDGKGERDRPGSPLPPGGAAALGVPVNSPLVVTGADGRCRAVYLSAAQPSRVVLR